MEDDMRYSWLLDNSPNFIGIRRTKKNKETLGTTKNQVI